MAAEKKQSTGWKWRLDDEDKPVIIDKWDGSAAKNSLDDAAKKLLTKQFKYQENSLLVDIRLIICTVACLFALFGLVYDYLNPFPQSKNILVMCVISYFALMAILTWYSTYQEKSIFFVGHNKDESGVDPDDVWTLESFLQRFDDMYTLHVTYMDGKTRAKRSATLSKSVSNWFDEKGGLLTESYQAEIRNLHDNLLKEKKDK